MADMTTQNNWIESSQNSLHLFCSYFYYALYNYPKVARVVGRVAQTEKKTLCKVFYVRS
jgi:hypothetical protein